MGARRDAAPHATHRTAARLAAAEAPDSLLALSRIGLVVEAIVHALHRLRTGVAPQQLCRRR